MLRATRARTLSLRRAKKKVIGLREAARVFRESKISNEKSNFFLFYQNIPFCDLVAKKIF